MCPAAPLLGFGVSAVLPTSDTQTFILKNDHYHTVKYRLESISSDGLL